MLPSNFPELAADLTSLRILVVDDDDVDRERICRVIGKSTILCAVTEAATLGEARSLLKSSQFDGVFLDYQLGDASGTELLLDIKSGVLAYVPVIMVTGNDNERLVVTAMQDGAHDFIYKTHLRVELVEAILVNSQHRAQLERELKHERERLEYLSFYDALTALPNRTLFFDRAEQTLRGAVRHQQSFALMQIDLDLFKSVNDSFGHRAGDVVLSTVAQRMQSILRSNDTIARLGGDEFAAILTGTQTAEAALQIAEKITQEIRKPIAVDAEHLITIEASIGITLYPDHGQTIQALMLKADWAMYAAKHGARLYELYGDHMESMRPHPVPESNLLKQAIEHNELFLEYQPVLELASRRISGVEALVRWRGADGKTVPPGLFIPQAERSPLIRPLTYWVLHAALDQAQKWHADGLLMPVSVNISARMLDDLDLAPRVMQALATRALPSSLLTLELTETALMSNVNRAQKILAELSAAGVGVSIDDFGAGYTSFKYLRQLDVSQIKIDMAFTADLAEGSRDSVIVRSIAVLASGFGITAVAEGVEDLGNSAKLLALGCFSGQGYGIARPMRGEDMAGWVADWNARERPG